MLFSFTYICSFRKQHNYFIIRAAISSIKLQLSKTLTGAGLARRARSPVIMPSSIVESVAFSSFLAKSTRSFVPSSYPRFASEPVQAKINATGFVEVFSPFM